MDKVSVIMPVYNVQDTLGLAIASVLEQTHRDFELILVDDGSTDQSSAMCQAMALQDERIRVIHQPNQGLAAARNTGIAAAAYDIVALLDSDDLWIPDKLERHVALLQKHPEVGVTYSASQFINDAGEHLALCQTPKVSGVMAKDVLLRNPIGNGSAPVIRKHVFDEIEFVDDKGVVNYFDVSLRQSEDIECWVRMVTTTDWKFQGIPQPLTLYRINDNGLSANTDKQLASWEIAQEKMQGYAPDLIRRYGRLARAFQYRYLARRAVRSMDVKTARRFCLRALVTAPSIIWHEPGRTLTTVVAVAALSLLPRRWYTKLEAFGCRLNAKINPSPTYSSVRA